MRRAKNEIEVKKEIFAAKPKRNVFLEPRNKTIQKPELMQRILNEKLSNKKKIEFYGDERPEVDL